MNQFSLKTAREDFACELNCIFNFTQHVRRQALDNGITGDNAVLTALQLRNMAMRLTRYAHTIRRLEERSEQHPRPTRLK